MNTATLQIGTNLLIAFEVVIAHQAKKRYFGELTELEKETLKDYVGQEIIDVLFFLAFMGSFSLTSSAWVRLSVVFIAKFFEYLSELRQETVCRPPTATATITTITTSSSSSSTINTHTDATKRKGRQTHGAKCRDHHHLGLFAHHVHGCALPPPV